MIANGGYLDEYTMIITKTCAKRYALCRLVHAVKVGKEERLALDQPRDPFSKGAHERQLRNATVRTERNDNQRRHGLERLQSDFGRVFALCIRLGERKEVAGQCGRLCIGCLGVCKARTEVAHVSERKVACQLARLDAERRGVRLDEAGCVDGGSVGGRDDGRVGLAEEGELDVVDVGDCLAGLCGEGLRRRERAGRGAFREVDLVIQDNLDFRLLELRHELLVHGSRELFPNQLLASTDERNVLLASSIARDEFSCNLDACGASADDEDVLGGGIVGLCLAN